MSTADSTATCGCCAGLVLATPVSIENRPGLSAVAYRIGSHPRFKASLLARLATSDHPALRRLTTRQDDDFAVALCDAWAAVADVITFYQERIANESYLRTAIERRSVAELARLIDYSLRPGVAAATHLAFNMETAEGAPKKATIPAGTKVMSVPGPGEKPQTFETTAELLAKGSWNRFRARSTRPGEVEPVPTSVALAGTNTALVPGDRILFVGQGRRASAASTDWTVRTLTGVEPDSDNDRTVVRWDDLLPPLGDPVEVFALRRQCALMGHNAPDPRNLATATRTLYGSEITLTPTGGMGDWAFTVDPGHAYLDAAYPGILSDDLVLFTDADGVERLLDVTASTVLTRSAYSMSLRATRLTLEPAAELDQFHGTALRGTSVHFQPERLALADVPAAAVEGDAIELDTAVSDLPAGRLLLIEGTDADTGVAAGETVTLLKVEPAGSGSQLLLTASLSHRYEAESVVIHGNVASATHGETVRETLGSGDGASPFQRLKLRQSPLTYVQAKSATGAESTLELRVNGLLWKETRTLQTAAPGDRAFVARQQDDGSTMIEFGDGVTGARLPTGRENVTAVYRKGIGSAGLLEAGQLSQLITRPLGVKDARNPLATEGAEDAESLDAARDNCTLTIHTLDRVVSLQDYEDFARAFAGIAKSLATWFWDGRRRGVFITVAGPSGTPISETSDTRSNLIAAIRQRGDAHVPIDVRSYSPVTFGARVAIAAAPDRLRADVVAAARKALVDGFGFDARRFAQPVTIDEVLAVAQSPDGVRAANVTRLNIVGLTGVEHRLTAAAPSVASGTLAGAQLLTLDPADLELTELA